MPQHQVEAIKSQLKLQAQLVLNERLTKMNAIFEEQKMTRERAEKKRREREKSQKEQFELSLDELKVLQQHDV